MNAAFASEVAAYQAMPAECIEANMAALEATMRRIQRQLAAARKAQKNQKRAAKKERKVVG